MCTSRQMEEAVDIYRRMKDDRNKLDLANTLNSLAALYWNQSEYDRAEVLVPIFKERRDVRAKGIC
jgi:pentatricopeptide repeat protein